MAQPNGGNAKQEPAPANPDSQASVSLEQTDRKLARTAELTITSPDVPETVRKASAIAVAAGGYTGLERTSDRSALMTLAVPSDRLDQTLSDLAATGDRVVNREVQAKDVTEQVVDVESRLTTQRASVERVRVLLAQATSVSEITSIERELTTREAELESLLARQKSLTGSVAMATVSLQVSNSPNLSPAAADNSGFLGGLASGWSAFLSFGTWFLTAFGAMLPFLVLAAIPLVIFLRWRKRRAPAPVETPDTA